MFRLTTIALAACATAMAAMPEAKAADMIPPPPIPPVVMKGWYLRGDIGYANQQVDSLDNALYDTYTDVWTITKDFDGAPFLAAGLGYRWNRWFRTDVTGEYRSRSDFTGLDIANAAGTLIPDNYTAQKSEWLAMFNGYIDLGTWHGITPFVGAGVGAARITIHDFTDVGPTVASVAFGGDHSEWNFAWALHAGLGMEITDALTLELAYRYLDMGDAESGDLVTYTGINAIDNPMIFKDITAHDLKLGVRYTFW